MSKVLVTGGAGYIGSVLVRLLINKGYKVRVLDRLFFGKESLVDIEDKIELIKGDVRDVRKEVFDGIDTVMDLAAISNDPSGELDKQKTLDINYLGRTRIAHLAKLSGVRRYILASSCSIYGFQDDVLTEESKVNPLTTYAEANYLAEKSTLSLADETFCVTALRQSTVFGFSNRMRFDLVVNGMVGAYYQLGYLELLRDGNQWRPHIHVKDTGKAFIEVMEAEKEKVNGEIFNVGSNDLNIQIFDLGERICKGINKPFYYKWHGTPDKRSYRVNFDKIKNVLGYETKYSIEEATREIWNKMEHNLINWDDPKTRTVNWYDKLIKSNKQLKEVSRFGDIL
ncbi:NAD-dependent epimerase/dehydratase family protein [Brassicibacter mesophilus]|uniref:NAD-dependent epimerase/dehydratase family protein n=1 Tax=Brassicibacter mesophilus TaxID=745119 RepID=UPI003D24A7A0